MSLLAALTRAYERLPDAPRPGFSSEKIGFCILIDADGAVKQVLDLRDTDKKRTPRQIMVPQAVKRTVGISPNFLWDKSAYVLGVTAGEGKRTADEHEAFRQMHSTALEGETDPGLVALSRFLANWTPEKFALPVWSEEVLDQNIVFRLAKERGYLHERPAARELCSRIAKTGAADAQRCLVTGADAPPARLHPSIKGVWGAQSSGASLVSFNLDAFTSYGHDQGDNAPVSQDAAFAYGTALNKFLEKESGHRMQIGDASTVFWADAEEAAAAQDAEYMFGSFFDTAAVEADAAQRIEARLSRIRNGQPLADVAPDLANGVRFHVLGLAPNAARLSVRFWREDDFGTLTEHYQRHLADMLVDPAPRDGWPPLWRYLIELAAQGKRENVPPLIAGDWMRSILSGTRYPLTLMSTTLMRIRADNEINALRVAVLKSVLIRNFSREVPVALDPGNTNKGYVLGRLFAAYEEVQRAALGNNVNATIKDKFYGAASASPQKVFRTLDAGSQNHFSKLRKLSTGRAVNLEKLISAIMDLMDPSEDPIPSSLAAAEQAMFGIGYYHQRSDFFRKRETPSDADTAEQEMTE